MMSNQNSHSLPENQYNHFTKLKVIYDNVHLPFNSASLLLSINPTETCLYVHQKTYADMFIVKLFITASNRK